MIILNVTNWCFSTSISGSAQVLLNAGQPSHRIRYMIRTRTRTHLMVTACIDLPLGASSSRTPPVGRLRVTTTTSTLNMAN